ncbi:MAG: hypothetical protein ABJO29_00855 [Yoonia sp.]|uniref:hypothetical protein n=1 Tax=Yoonia sp. TaxID=2212373 RepID=UPI0032980F8F
MTETCITCGDIELYYVLSCGDAAVGDSVILMFGGEDHDELKAEIDVVQDAFNEISQNAAEDSNEGAEATVQAQDHLAKMLDGYIKPDVSLPEKHMVQAYNLRGRKWTFIRSDKMRNHMRSYAIDKSLLEATSEGLNKGGLRSAFTAAREKIASDLGGGISWKGQIYKASVGGSITDIWDADFLTWVDAVNESMAYSNESPYHDLSAGAQLLRGYAGFGLAIGYNPSKNSYGLTGNAEARAVLAEGKTTITGYVPHADGWFARAPFADAAASEAGRQEALNFGYFRGTIELKLHAMLGASIMGTAGIEYVPQPDGSTQVQPAAAGAKGQVSAGAFAGVEAGGSLTGGVQWLNPGWREDEGQRLRDAGWKTMVSIGGTAAVNAGVGAEFDLMITFENGKFMFRAKAQVVWGVGAKGGVSGSIGFEAIIEFVMYTYHQLRANGFSYLVFIHKEAFDAMVQMLIYAVQFGEDAMIALGNGASQLASWVMQPFEDADAAEAFAIKVKQQPRALFFGPPEVKGAVLYRLSERFTFSREEHQEGAIIAIMHCISSRREWEKIVERITPNGQKSSATAGLARLNAVLDFGAQTQFNTRLAEILAMNDIYDYVAPGDTRFAGAPVTFSSYA